MATDRVKLNPETDFVINGAIEVPRFTKAKTMLARIPRPFLYKVLVEEIPRVMMPEQPKPTKVIEINIANGVFKKTNKNMETILRIDKIKIIYWVFTFPVIILTNILPAMMAI
jgi:hypothetical protein